MKIAIIGAGHAGVTVAQQMAKEKIPVDLYSAEEFLPYYRPRLVAVAFAQTAAQDILMHPKEWYQQQQINLILNSKIQTVTPDATITLKDNSQIKYDKIIVATGAFPFVPENLQCNLKHVTPLWTIKDAKLIKQKITSNPNQHLIIIGGGVIGIETALRATDAGAKVTIIERENYLLKRNFSLNAAQIIYDNLKQKGITVITSGNVESITQQQKKLTLNINKQTIQADLVIISIGAISNHQLIQDKQIKIERGILVDDYLQANNKIFACGDVCQLAKPIPNSAREALKQGKIVAQNIITPQNQQKYQYTQVAMQLKYKDFIIKATGQCNNNNKEIILENSPENYRSYFEKDNKIIGIQMVGNIAEFNKYEKLLNNN